MSIGASNPSIAATSPSPAHRVVVERIRPAVDAGRFPVKRTSGDTVDVTADIFADGHDVIVAMLRDRHVSVPTVRAECAAGAHASSRDAAMTTDTDGNWRETPMVLRAPDTDEWGANFEVGSIGWHEFSIVAWVDQFQSWRRDLRLKVDAGQDVRVELVEGALLVRSAAAAHAARHGTGAGPAGEDPTWLLGVAEVLDDPKARERAVPLALEERLATAMLARADRSRATISQTYRIWVDRTRARFGAWYEMFPRSAGDDPTRSATFAEASSRLPAIADLGFNVLYLPPIHPIGHSFRKGRNNSLTAGPGDPGSPWAIGSAAGGHTAVDPGLGTLDDFEAFCAEAGRLGLEVALDLAWQCSPDHPWVHEHPEWFLHRPDGTIKYAENPPKKYQDIVPLNFTGEAWESLWRELLEVTRFWIRHGIRIFRVDNPHTKPFTFWEWLIDEIHAEYPDVILLAEAFTRPKVMRYLAKAGFTQSYTYFTWRNTKSELIEYFTELTTTEVREYFRPNLFTNTPDILHAYLQQGGRPAFEARLLLAATLGANYGIYSGFELCEGRAVPGTEEYLDSEKYQYRVWDWNRPGNINDLIARVNDARRTEPALQSDTTLRFLDIDNPQIIAYSKSSEGAYVIAIVNLDPHGLQQGFVRIPRDITRLASAADGSFTVRDLLDDGSYTWNGEWNYVRLEPDVRQGHLFKLKTEN